MSRVGEQCLLPGMGRVACCGRGRQGVGTGRMQGPKDKDRKGGYYGLDRKVTRRATAALGAPRDPRVRQPLPR